MTSPYNQAQFNALTQWRELAKNNGIDGPFPTDEQFRVYLADADLPQPTVIQAWSNSLESVVRQVDLDIWAPDDDFDWNLFIPDAELIEKARTEAEQPEPPQQVTPTPVSTPQPEPQEAPKAATPTHPQRREEFGTFNPEDLRDYEEEEFEELDPFDFEGPIPGAKVKVKKEDEGVSLRWMWPRDQQPTSDVQLYRVVVLEEEYDSDPDPAEGFQRAVTVGDRWIDPEPLRNAYRIYQVWVHEGIDEEDALSEQPRLLGEEYYYRPIEDIDLQWDGTTLRGTWAYAKFTERVEVHIVEKGAGKPTQRRYSRCTETANLNGFEWEPDALGVTYQVVAQRTVRRGHSRENSRWSAVYEIDIPAKVVSIDIDMQEIPGDSQRFRVSWNKPQSGELRIYRTQEAPEDGIEDRDLELDQLPELGLAEGDQISTSAVGQEECEITWPVDWYSIFVTPVSVVGNQCRVGKSLTRVRAGNITHEQLYERIDHELITFGWPEESSAVIAFVTSPDHRGTLGADPLAYKDAHPDEIQGIDQISYQDYQTRGGMRVRLPGACKVILYPMRTYEGVNIWGEPTSLDYRGIRRYRYKIEKKNGNNIDRLFLSIFSETEQNSGGQFTLRYHPSRLPLEPGDGEEVRTKRYSQSGNNNDNFYPGVISERLMPDQPWEMWEIESDILASGTGFLRLFFRYETGEDKEQQALLDPYIRDLWVPFYRQGGES